MPEFRTANLGETLALAENIKGMRRQAETDRLRDIYLGVQTQNAQQAGKIAGQQESREQGEYDAKRAAQDARIKYLQTDAILRSPDPVAAIKQYAPDMIEEIEKANGPGSFSQIPPEQLIENLRMAVPNLAAKAGISLNGTPEQQFAAAQAKEKDAADFEQQKELLRTGHGYDLEKIKLQGQFQQERTAAGEGRKTFKDQQALRKEFEGLDTVKNYRAVQPIINSARNAPDTGYGDMDLIYAVGKVLDPNSVVREGELALTIAAGSPLQRILGAGRFSLEKGGRLTPQSRQQLLQMLDGRVGALKERYDQEAQRYSGYAQENGWNPAQITGNQPSAPGANDGPGSGNVVDWSQLK